MTKSSFETRILAPESIQRCYRFKTIFYDVFWSTKKNHCLNINWNLMAMVTGIYSHNGIPFSSWILLCFLSKTSSHSEFELFLNHYGQQQCTGIFISDVTISLWGTSETRKLCLKCKILFVPWLNQVLLKIKYLFCDISPT